MQAGIVLVDDRLNSGREVAHGLAQVGDLEDDHPVYFARAYVPHELLVIVALYVPISSLVLVNGDPARWDVKLLDGVIPRLLFLPGKVLVSLLYSRAYRGLFHSTFGATIRTTPCAI